MERLSVGDRVVILCPKEKSSLAGKQGRVWAIHRAPHFKWNADARAKGARWWQTAYLLDIDGAGRLCDGFGGGFAFPRSYLHRITEDAGFKPPVSWPELIYDRLTKILRGD